jgi:hypothetical protein
MAEHGTENHQITKQHKNTEKKKKYQKITELLINLVERKRINAFCLRERGKNEINQNSGLFIQNSTHIYKCACVLFTFIFYTHFVSIIFSFSFINN